MRRSLLDSARPEIVLEDWARQAGGKHSITRDKITFQTIRNHGRGSAYHIAILCPQPDDNNLAFISSYARLPILAPNEEASIDGEISILWNNIMPAAKGPKYLACSVEVYCWDSKGMRHKTLYRLMVLEPKPGALAGDGLAPGVLLTSRTTISQPVWLLKLSAKWGKVLEILNKVRHWKLGAKT